MTPLHACSETTKMLIKIHTLPISCLDSVLCVEILHAVWCVNWCTDPECFSIVLLNSEPNVVCFVFFKIGIQNSYLKEWQWDNILYGFVFLSKTYPLWVHVIYFLWISHKAFQVIAIPLSCSQVYLTSSLLYQITPRKRFLIFLNKLLYAPL